MRGPLIQTYEHTNISLGTDFTSRHRAALLELNNNYAEAICKPTIDGVRFTQYVGIVQLGELTIEILPKVDSVKSGEMGATDWQRCLIDLLVYCGKLPASLRESAQLATGENSLLILYIGYFLDRVELLVQQGLISAYRRCAENKRYFAGNLDVARHLQQNLLHRERFYIQHQVYDQGHFLNEVIAAALEVVSSRLGSGGYQRKARELRGMFPERSSWPLLADVDNIHYDLNARHYQEVIGLARLFLADERPQPSRGEISGFSLLFGMNHLFERFLYLQLDSVDGVTVSNNTSYDFWDGKKLEPDLVVEIDGRTMILDAKWKLLRGGKPKNADLYQLYTYHRFAKAERSFLIYPEAEGNEARAACFMDGLGSWGEVVPVAVVRAGRLNFGVGEELVKTFK
jgi:5-methylcytosine-specific restriction enzyme subunit McrC